MKKKFNFMEMIAAKKAGKKPVAKKPTAKKKK